MSIVEFSALVLQRFYHWEGSVPQTVSLIQPMGGDVIKEFTRAEVSNQMRRMAMHLQNMGKRHGWEPGDRVAILSKNCAWWLMSDLEGWLRIGAALPDAGTRDNCTNSDAQRDPGLVHWQAR